VDHQELIESRNDNHRRFVEIPKLWLSIGKMNESFFSKELPHTSISNTLFSVLLLTGFSVIISILGSIIGDIIGHITTSTNTSTSDISRISTSTRILFLFCGMIITPISFYLNNGITYISAHLLGGKGNYSSQAYLHSLFYVPLGVVAGLIGLFSAIPTVGNCIVVLMGLVIAIFDFILRVKVFKVVHDFTTRKSIIAIISPIIVLLLIPLCLLVLLMIMSSTINYTFTNMINSI
jgi:hypothetical protein